MLGVQTVIATGMTTALAYLGFGLALGLLCYACYYYVKRQSPTPLTEDFAALRRKRHQQSEDIQVYHASTAVRFQLQADELITGLQEQQENLAALLEEFDRELDTAHKVSTDLEANTTVINGIISPLRTLLTKMHQQYAIMSQQILNLTKTLYSTNTALAERENEVAEIVQSLKTIESNAAEGMTQLSTGLSAIVSLRNTFEKKTQRIHKLEEDNEQLTDGIADLTTKMQKLAAINESQKKLIEALLRPDSENVDPNQRSRTAQSQTPMRNAYSSKMFRGVEGVSATNPLYPSSFGNTNV